MCNEEFVPQYDITLNDLDEIIDVFQPSHKYWSSQYANTWMFRGHSLEKWELIPSVYRKEVYEKWGFAKDENNLLRSMVEFEFELIKKFLELCNSAGLQLPEQAFTFIMNPDRRQVNAFGPDGNQHLRDFPTIELQHILALAQHHNIPTRLLDFSFDPLTALFFAAEKSFCESDKELFDNNSFFVVYAINRCHITQKFDIFREIHTPSFANENLKHQKGLFLLDIKANETLEKGELPSDLESFLKNKFKENLKTNIRVNNEIDNNRYYYRKIKIPENLRVEVLKHLHQRHYNRAHLFPSYENVAETVKILPSLERSNWRKVNAPIAPT